MSELYEVWLSRVDGWMVAVGDSGLHLGPFTTKQAAQREARRMNARREAQP